MKKILFIIQSDPYSNSAVSEAIDMAYAAAAYDIEAAMLFTGQGITCLVKGQNADVIEQKSIEKKIQALPIYGVDSIWVELPESLTIKPDFTGIAQPVTAEQKEELLKSFDEVQVF